MWNEGAGWPNDVCAAHERGPLGAEASQEAIPCYPTGLFACFRGNSAGVARAGQSAGVYGAFDRFGVCGGRVALKEGF